MMLPKYIIYGFISLSLILEITTGTRRCGTVVEVCPPSWNQWGNKCYKVTEKQPWLQAKQECIKMGGVLVVPQFKEETNFLLSMSGSFWIDCNDLETEGSWECQEGTTNVEYTDWDRNQPSGTGLLGSEEDCAAVWSLIYFSTPGKWNDISCDKQQAAICKMPASTQLQF